MNNGLLITIALSLQGVPSMFQQVWSWINHPFNVGNFSVSISSVALGALTILVAILVSRSLRTLLQRRLEKKPRVDPGLQYTFLRLLHYIIILTGFLLAFKTSFNADLTTLAVLFTALSVGIGFGLQYIAGDIAAGFVLLFERPVRVNDYVTITSDAKLELMGNVQSINLRTTNIVTNDRLTIIVPNSKLVNHTVVNWSYGDRRVRISIPIGVSYDSDVERVTETLLRAADGVKFVIDDPAPSVQFLNFGDSSMDFRLLVWTSNPRRHPSIKSEINYRIWRLFKEEKIEIPLPQQELRMRSGNLPFESIGGDRESASEK